MRIVYLIILLEVFPLILTHGQIKVNLSEKHLNKVNKQASASKKLALYRKYFSKDSIKYIKKAERYWQAQTDSLMDAIAQREEAFAKKSQRVKDGVNSRIFRTVYRPWAKRQANAHVDWLTQHGITASFTSRQILLLFFEDYFLQTTQNDSLLTVLRSRMPSLPMPKQLASKIRDYQLINPDRTENIRQLVKGKLNGIETISKSGSLQGKAQQYSGQVTKYSGFGKVLSNTDSLKGFARAEGEKVAKDYLSKADEYSQVSELKRYEGEIDKLKTMPGKYKSQIEQLQDSAYIKNKAKKKAEELAMNYITEHPEVMQGVQKKMSLLMKKYSVVPNSTDLSTAIKRTSLKDKPLRERVYFATNFQFVSLDPFNIDFSPMAGYRFNKNFLVGMGANYRQSFGDSIPTLSPNVFGYKAFSSYDVVKNFFLYGEFDRNSTGVEEREDVTHRIWRNAAFLGVGRKISIHPRIEMTMIFMYNFLYDHPDPIYPKRWNIRIGVQTSALALFKPKPIFK